MLRHLRSAGWWLHTPRARPLGRPVPVSRSGTLELACAADERYVPHCAAMLHSALSQTPEMRVRVHFLHEPRLSSQTLMRLRTLVEGLGGDFIPTAVPDEQVANLHATGHISRVAWYRSLLPELRPDLDRILYLDCDTIVTDPLAPLWDTPLDGYFVAAVRNVIARELATRHHALGIPPDQPYFNSGVLLMNLALMRAERSVETVLAHARSHTSKLIWVDQDSLNYAFGARCRLLHPRWNCQTSVFYWRDAEEVFGTQTVHEALAHPAIVHFEGPELSKPWNYLCKHPYRRHYRAHRAAAGWPMEAPEGRNWRRALLRLLPMRLLPHALGLARRIRGRLRRLSAAVAP